MEAAETWHHDKLDGISWIISGDKQVDEDTKALVSMRDSGAQHLQVAKSILACESGLSGAINAKLKNLLAKLSYVSTDMEDRLGVFFSKLGLPRKKKEVEQKSKDHRRVCLQFSGPFSFRNIVVIESLCVYRRRCVPAQQWFCLR